MKKSVDVPVLVGSGVTLNNVHAYMGADGFIIGSYFKKNGMYVISFNNNINNMSTKTVFDINVLCTGGKMNSMKRLF